MNLQKLQWVVVDALEDVKAQDIRVFDTTDMTGLFDRVVLASGTSNRQTRALADRVREKVKQAGGSVLSVEGGDTGEWVLVDLADIVVHVMQPAIRQYYNLEELWGDRPVSADAIAAGRHADGAAAGAPGSGPAPRRRAAVRKADATAAAGMPTEAGAPAQAGAPTGVEAPADEGAAAAAVPKGPTAPRRAARKAPATKAVASKSVAAKTPAKTPASKTTASRAAASKASPLKKVATSKAPAPRTTRTASPKAAASVTVASKAPGKAASSRKAPAAAGSATARKPATRAGTGTPRSSTRRTAS